MWDALTFLLPDAFFEAYRRLGCVGVLVLCIALACAGSLIWNVAR